MSDLHKLNPPKQYNQTFLATMNFKYIDDATRFNVPLYNVHIIYSEITAKTFT